MGMFTSIIDSNGIEFQIKGGEDDCERYKVGDTVDWKIWPDRPGEGKLLDGVYDGCGPLEDKWVIIKDHKVFKICSKISVGGIPVSDQYLEDTYDIAKYNHEWWAEKAWLLKDIKDTKSEIKHLEWKLADNKKTLKFLRSIVYLSAGQIKIRRKKFNELRVAKIMAEPIITIMNYQGFARKVFKVKKLRDKRKT